MDQWNSQPPEEALPQAPTSETADTADELTASAPQEQWSAEPQPSSDAQALTPETADIADELTASAPQEQWSAEQQPSSAAQAPLSQSEEACRQAVSPAPDADATDQFVNESQQNYSQPQSLPQAAVSQAYHPMAAPPQAYPAPQQVYVQQAAPPAYLPPAVSPHAYMAPQPFYGQQTIPAQPQSSFNPYQRQPVQTNYKGPAKKIGAWLIVLCLLVSLAGGLGGAYLWRGPSSQPFVLERAGLKPTGPPKSFIEDPNSWTEVVNKIHSSIVEVHSAIGSGSGVIISEDGYIITNDHVVAGSSEIYVILLDGSTYNATLVYTEYSVDTAVIKIDATGLNAASIGDSSTVHVGDRVLALGNPTGILGGTATEGIVSAVNRSLFFNEGMIDFLQFSAATSPGSSGGGLFNARGEMIGLVNSKMVGEGVENLGFAIPANTAFATVYQHIPQLNPRNT